MAHDVFISYSSRNLNKVYEISEFLESNGIKCFLAARDIPKGIEWATVIPDAIKDSCTFLVIHSSEYNESVEVDREIKIATDNKKKIITLRIDSSDFNSAKEYYLTVINWIDLSNEKAYEDLLKSILESLNKPVNVQVKFPKRTVDYSFLWFVGLFILLFFAGFLHAHFIGTKSDNLKHAAIQNIEIGKTNKTLIYSQTDEIIVFDQTTGKIESLPKNLRVGNSLQNSNQNNALEAKLGYVGIGVLLSKVFNVKVKGRNAVYYYVGATIAVVCGYGIGYYVHERFFPNETSNAMKEFLLQKSNWIQISNEFEKYEKYLNPNSQ